MMALIARAAAFIAALLFGASGSKPLAATVAPMPTDHPPVAQTAPLSVMPLGDSITAGVGPNGVALQDGGYRLALEHALTESGYRVQMVGERTDFSADLGDPHHEGWPGYVLRSLPSDPAPQLYGDVTNRAITTYRPQIVLLMAGTNDLLRYAHRSAGYTLPEIAHSLDLEIGQILTLDPSVRLIVAPVVDSPRVPHAAIVSFSGAVRTLVERYQAQGYHIDEAAGMDGAVPRGKDYFPDGIHPSGKGGYALIAGVWYRSMGEVLAAWPPGSPGVGGKPTVANTTTDHAPR